MPVGSCCRRAETNLTHVMTIAYVTFCDVEHIECKVPSEVGCETKVDLRGKKFSHTGTNFPRQRPSLASNSGLPRMNKIRIPEGQQP